MMDPTLFFVFMLVAFILGVVAVVQSGAKSVVAWALVVGFGALAYNAYQLVP